MDYLHAFEVKRPSPDRTLLDRKMLFTGFVKIIKIQPEQGRAKEGIPAEVVFDKAWIFYWIYSYVFQKLGVTSLGHFCELIKECQDAYFDSEYSGQHPWIKRIPD